MNTVTKLKILAVIGLAFTVINCSKSGGSDSGTTNGQCASGQLYTNAGCLQTCGNGQVVYNGQCVSSASIGVGAINGINGINGQYGYGQYQSCGTNMVIYNGQCVPLSSIQQTQYGGTGGLCDAGCGAGQVRTFQGCAPQFTCAPCYGNINGTCYIGVNAHQYYGY